MGMIIMIMIMVLIMIMVMIDHIVHCSGPLSASVAASDWSSYHGGVFDGCDYNGNMVFKLLLKL